MQKRDFIEYYKTLSTADLLEILSNKKDYQELAIGAAQEEFDKRSLSESELNEANEQLLIKKRKKDEQRKKIEDAEIKLKNAVNKIADNINPIQQEKPTSDRSIKTISIIYGGFFLFQLLSDFRMNLAIAKDFSRYPVSSIISLAPLILIPVACILFFMKKKPGWILLTGLIACLSVEIVWSFINSLNDDSGSSGGLNSLFPKPSIISYFLPLAILAGTLYLLCKDDIRKEFKISKSNVQGTLVVSALLTILLLVEA